MCTPGCGKSGWGAFRFTCWMPTWKKTQTTTARLTARLYSSDLDLRISQEILLGIGGVRALRVLGYTPSVWHMNEGHAAFLVLERICEFIAKRQYL